MPETIELIEAIRPAKLRFGAAIAEWVGRSRRGRLWCSSGAGCEVEEVGVLVGRSCCRVRKRGALSRLEAHAAARDVQA
jgi:hypothetical protein